MIFLPQADVAQCGIQETFGRIIILVRLREVCGVSSTKCFKVIRGRRARLCPCYPVEKPPNFLTVVGVSQDNSEGGAILTPIRGEGVL